MRIIVTGGMGFLGSHLTERLLEQGNDVLVIDNLVTGRECNLKNAKEKFGNKLQFLNRDIIDLTQESWWRIYRISGYKFDMIFNFACPASPPAYQKKPIHTTLTCVVGTKNMLDLAKRDNAIFVHASTSEIYGDPEVHPQNESYKGCVNTIGIRSNYDEGKRCAESLIYDYKRKYNLKVRVPRIFNTYGPRMDPNDGRVVSNFICQILKEEDVTIYGDGLQTRSFCYVDDLIDGILKLSELKEDPQTPVNIGNPNEFTINQLVNILISTIDGVKLTTYSHKVINLKFPQDDPKQRCPNIELAKRLLDWEPKISLINGLNLTIKYFKKELGIR